ncbi:MAG: hypothetical protein B6244_10495 [Candidatus Cloacimonetes bacterium 4572_55]|nr:MAG: hypothetical protein B6244_10495 [Candidatus Cloacimonetes bacterium 4572_55]
MRFLFNTKKSRPYHGPAFFARIFPACIIHNPRRTKDLRCLIFNELDSIFNDISKRTQFL